MERILEVAKGERKAEKVLKGANLVNVRAKEIEERDIAIQDGHIVGVGKYRGREEIDAGGLYAAPGFIDAHIHVESTLLTPAQFARVAVPTGTTTVVSDPHEIANVMGVKGINFMVDDAEEVPLKYYFTAPSCVPSTELETSGARLGPEKIERLLDRERCVGLGEVMNFPGVINGDEEVLSKVQAARKRNLAIDGHAPMLSGKELNAYISQGIKSEHECSTASEAREKLSLGMRIMARQGSSAKNLEALVPVLKSSPEDCMLVTDDRHPDDLMEQGHVDYLLCSAVQHGVDPVEAIRMVSLNPAEYFGLKTGRIVPGAPADIVLLKDLEEFRAEKVFVDGELVADGGNPRFESGKGKEVRNTVNVDKVEEKDLDPDIKGEVRVIGLIEGQLLTESLTEEITEYGDKDVLPLAVIERHEASGNVGKGFVKGFGLEEGALASTVGHDSHNLIVVGTDTKSMKTAAEKLIEVGGGMAAARGKELLSILELPVAGLMSRKQPSTIRAKFKSLTDAARELGCKIDSPFMMLSFLTLPVIPELKLTDKGLVDVEKSEIVGLKPEKINN